MTTLVCLGLGYCARHYVSEFGARFKRIIGTGRDPQRAASLGRQYFASRPVEMLVFDGKSASPALAGAIAGAEALLISAAPEEGRDPVLATLAGPIEAAAGLRSVALLSTLGVYGDSGGAWIDETAPT